MIFCIRIKLRMNIQHVLFFCFLSALQDGNAGLVSAIDVFAGAEGGSGSISCYLTSSGSTKFFCKGENILIKTDDVTAQSGRYSIRYRDGTSGRRSVSVTITQLTKSDSGRYRFGLGGSSGPDSYCEFDLILIDAATLGDNTPFIRVGTVGGSITYGCFDTVYGSRKFFCKNECKRKEDILIETEENKAQNGRYSTEYIERLYVTITELKKSDKGRYMCGYGRPSSPDSSYRFSVIVVDAPTTSKPTSVPSDSTPTTTQSLIASSSGFTTSSTFSETTEQFTAVSNVAYPGYFWSLVVFVPVVVVLLAVVPLLLYKWKKRRNSVNTRGTSDNRNMELSAIYENCPQVSTYEENIYENLDPGSRDPHQIFSTLTPNK